MRVFMRIATMPDHASRPTIKQRKSVWDKSARQFRKSPLVNRNPPPSVIPNLKAGRQGAVALGLEAIIARFGRIPVWRFADPLPCRATLTKYSPASGWEHCSCCHGDNPASCGSVCPPPDFGDLRNIRQRRYRAVTFCRHPSPTHDPIHQNGPTGPHMSGYGNTRKGSTLDIVVINRAPSEAFP